MQFIHIFIHKFSSSNCIAAIPFVIVFRFAIRAKRKKRTAFYSISKEFFNCIHSYYCLTEIIKSFQLPFFFSHTLLKVIQFSVILIPQMIFVSNFDSLPGQYSVHLNCESGAIRFYSHFKIVNYKYTKRLYRKFSLIKSINENPVKLLFFLNSPNWEREREQHTKKVSKNITSIQF